MITSKKTLKISLIVVLLVLCFAGYFLYNASATITSLSVTYEGDTEMGTDLDSDNKGFIVKAIYSNGREKVVDDWKIERPQRLAANCASTVHIIYKDFDVPVEIMCTTVLDRIEAEYTGSTEPGTTIVTDDIKVNAIYSNGDIHNIIGFKTDGEYVLKSGRKEAIKITYMNKECTLYVQCDIKKPSLNGNIIDCTTDDFVGYLDSQTIDDFVIEEKLDLESETEDGAVSRGFSLKNSGEAIGDLLIIEKEGHIDLLFLSMADGKNIGDSYAWSLLLASLIDDTLDRTNDDIKAELVNNGKLSHNGLSIWNMSSITNGRCSCMIAPTESEANIEDIAESEDIPDNTPNGIRTSEADWNNWKSSHSISLYSFMRSSSSVDFNWTIPENGDSKDKICYVVDENNNRLNNIYMMYGVQSQKITYVALYTDDSSFLESNEYKTNLRKLIQAYTADDKDGEVSVVISDDRADEIVNYIIDNRVEHCLVDEMKIRGLFSEDDEVYGITIGY